MGRSILQGRRLSKMDDQAGAHGKGSATVVWSEVLVQLVRLEERGPRGWGSSWLEDGGRCIGEVDVGGRAVAMCL